LEWDEKQPEAAQKEGDRPSNKDEEERPEDHLSYFRLASGCACKKDGAKWQQGRREVATAYPQYVDELHLPGDRFKICST
jgi:hypothetical protein